MLRNGIFIIISCFSANHNLIIILLVKQQIYPSLLEYFCTYAAFLYNGINHVHISPSSCSSRSTAGARLCLSLRATATSHRSSTLTTTQARAPPSTLWRSTTVTSQPMWPPLRGRPLTQALPLVSLSAHVTGVVWRVLCDRSHMTGVGWQVSCDRCVINWCMTRNFFI